MQEYKSMYSHQANIGKVNDITGAGDFRSPLIFDMVSLFDNGMMVCGANVVLYLKSSGAFNTSNIKFVEPKQLWPAITNEEDKVTAKLKQLKDFGYGHPIHPNVLQKIHKKMPAGIEGGGRRKRKSTKKKRKNTRRRRR